VDISSFRYFITKSGYNEETLLSMETLKMIPFPNIDPVMISIGFIKIHWYAMAYLLGFVLGIWRCKILSVRFKTGASPKDYDDFLSWAVIGTILGGRIGYVVFYNASYYLNNPLDAFQIWHGGMSFHGGMIGVIIATYLFTKHRKLNFISFTDILACVAPIGLFLGRIANFINGELFGRVTDAPWGIVFPNGGELPRHPSQLYEAGLEGILLFAILFILSKNSKYGKMEGFLSGAFLTLYSVFRFGTEFFREPDPQLGFLFANATMGQLLSIPMFIVGLYFVYKSVSRKI